MSKQLGNKLIIILLVLNLIIIGILGYTIKEILDTNKYQNATISKQNKVDKLVLQKLEVLTSININHNQELISLALINENQNRALIRLGNFIIGIITNLEYQEKVFQGVFKVLKRGSS